MCLVCLFNLVQATTISWLDYYNMFLTVLPAPTFSPQVYSPDSSQQSPLKRSVRLCLTLTSSKKEKNKKNPYQCLSWLPQKKNKKLQSPSHGLCDVVLALSLATYPTSLPLSWCFSAAECRTL